jgi:hypothetical protein
MISKHAHVKRFSRNGRINKIGTRSRSDTSGNVSAGRNLETVSGLGSRLAALGASLAGDLSVGESLVSKMGILVAMASRLGTRSCEPRDSISRTVAESS